MTAISIGVSNSTVLMKSCSSTPATTAGRKASSTPATKRRAPGSVGSARGEREQPAGIDRQDGEDRAELDQHLEGLAGRVEAEEVAGEQDVAGRGDRDELGQPLEDAEEGGDQVGMMLQGQVRARRFLRGRVGDRVELAVRAIGVEIALEHRVHRGRRMPRSARPRAPGATTLSWASSRTWSRVSRVLATSPPLSALARGRRTEALIRASQNGSVDQQPAALDDAEQPLHQLAEGRDLGAAELVDAGAAAPVAPAAAARGDVVDIDRLEAGVGADQRQHRRDPGHGAEAVEEAVVGAEDDRRPQDHRAGKGRAHRRLAAALGGGVEAVALGVGADRGDVDEARDALLGAEPGDAGRRPRRARASKVCLPASARIADAVDHRRRRRRWRRGSRPRRGCWPGSARPGRPRRRGARSPPRSGGAPRPAPASRPGPCAGRRSRPMKPGAAEDGDDGDGHGALLGAGDRLGIR